MTNPTPEQATLTNAIRHGLLQYSGTTERILADEVRRLQAALAEKEKELAKVGSVLIGLGEEKVSFVAQLAASQQRVAELEAERARQDESVINISILGTDATRFSSVPEMQVAHLFKRTQQAEADRDRMKAALTELHTRILADADEQDNHAMGEVLSGNKYKEQSYRSAAAGLRMAAGLVTEAAALATPAAQAATEETKPEPVFGNVSFCPVCNLMRANSHECNASDAPAATEQTREELDRKHAQFVSTLRTEYKAVTGKEWNASDAPKP